MSATDDLRARARTLLAETDRRTQLRWAIVLGDFLYGPTVAELLERLAKLEQKS